MRGANPESSSPTSPDSPILGLVKEAAGPGPQRGAASSGVPKQSSSKAPEAQAEGSTGAGARIIPFQTLPNSVKARLSDDLFEDPLLTRETMAELQEKMKWSYQFMRSQVLQEIVYNRKLLAEKDELIKQRWDQYLVMRNKYNDLVREHIERLMA